MREVNQIVIHCTATKENKYFDVCDIDRWHKQRGFKEIGYHYLILLDGTIQVGRNEIEVGAHVKGFNKHSIGVSYVGGLDSNGKAKDTRTEEQKRALILLLIDLKARYNDAEILGHRDFSKDLNGNGIIEKHEYMKQCPCFDVKKEYQNL